MRTRYFLQDQTNSGDPGTGGTVKPEDARAFLTSYGHAEDAVKGMPDPDVLKLHSTVYGNHQKAIESAVKAVKTDWPADWRQRLSDKDEKELKQLERYASPAEVWKKARELEKKVSAGELKAVTPFPEKGTAEEQAAWRKEQGVPDKPEAYDLKLDGGLVIGEDDKPLVDEFLKFAHGNHVPQSAVKKQLEWFLGDYREKSEAARAEAEAAALQAADDQLHKDWGPDYRANMNAITGLLDSKVSSKSGLKERVLKSIKLEPEFAKLWADVARELNPMPTLTNIDPARMEQSVNDEIGKIEKFMKTNRAEYNKDEKMQGRLRELYEARDRMSSKGRQAAA